MLLIILLGMWNLSDDNASDSPRLVLSTAIGPEHKEGEKSRDEAPVDEAEFELPASATPEEREELREADRVARELRLGPSEGAEFLPRLSKVKSDLRSSDPYRRMLAARDPRIRAEVVRREGGTTLTEAAVARSLRWMAAHQNADGSWSLHAFDHSPQCRGRCRGAGRVVSDAGGTALVLQAMFAAGQTPDVGIHRETVRHGLDWLLENQRPNGDLSAGSRGNTPMYVHGQATIALAEAYAVVGSSLEEPTRRALEFLCDAQHRQGGWRYNPRQAGDLSVTGWQLMALHTGRACGFQPPRITMLGASHFLDRVQSDREGGLYCYRPRENHSPAMTAEGLLSRMYLGWDRRDPGLERGVNFLIENHLPDAERPNIYYWYYATQVMHHWGGEPWEVWNRHMQAALPPLQEQHGHEAGSWYFDTNHGRQGGSLYATALATYTLEVYYRHGRLFDRLDLH